MDIYEVRRQRLLKLKDEQCGGKVITLADKIDTAQSYVSRMLYESGKKGKKNISDVMVKKISDAFNLPYGWLDGIDPNDDFSNIAKVAVQPDYQGSFPVLGTVSAGKFRDAIQRFDLEFLSTAIKCSLNSFWLIVDGHSMTAPFGSGITFPEGMYILVDPDREYTNKNFVVAYCETKSLATFKKISIEPEGTFLVPLNPDPTYKRINFAEEFCEIAGVVVDARWKLF
ncbi:LexA family transcriptional regulator [Vibrio diazotrophicus]|uniref:LexA family transcriptional regulator n=1 Tax=Vibrio diazotrophicus TaxID=685 RepID=UPI00142D9A49|nr:S24 family peptidase [Vibrio diazotrophicus]NIY91139.1 LexA family transcriptional repressor [Vibrio diazotrophicus]